MENKEAILTLMKLMGAGLTEAQRTDVWHWLRQKEMAARANEEIASAEMYATFQELL